MYGPCRLRSCGDPYRLPDLSCDLGIDLDAETLGHVKADRRGVWHRRAVEATSLFKALDGQANVVIGSDRDGTSALVNLVLDGAPLCLLESNLF